MYVIKRDGRKEPVHFDKITSRITRLCYGLSSEYVDACLIAQKVCMGVYKGVTTRELDELAAETAASMSSKHPDYGLLAARIAVSNLHKSTLKSFSETMGLLYTYINPKTGLLSSMLADDVYQFMKDNADVLNSAIVFDRDFGYDYFGFKTLERSYLLRIDGKVVERPQHMLMRVACGIHCGDLNATIETYNLLSLRWFTHATPTLFNSGTRVPQLSSCFLLSMFDDSIEGIYDTLKACAMISKQAGGIGVAVHNIRASGSYIRGTNGTSNGLVPMLRVFNNTARYVDQGGGKRKGAFAIYLEPWHADIFAFLELKKNHGIEEERARDLFFGLWVSDLFMKRVEEDGSWSLFCPNEAQGLCDSWGEQFEKLYTQYEATPGKARKVIKARQVWQAILEAQMETGTPYMLYKDAANRKSNQQNLGTIKSSNLCTEVLEYTSPEEVAVCNLASISLPMFVLPASKDNGNKPSYDFKKLYEVTYVVTRNLNRIIDVNHYPIKQAERSNKRHRPIGLGVQGLADAFVLMKYPFDSAEAKKLNKDIFETIYYGALCSSRDLAKRDGPYDTFNGSPISKGIFQFDMWGTKPESGLWDWESLRKDVQEIGVRNSLLLAPMPTASTSQIMGNNEGFEPYTSNLYTRRTLAGEFVCVSRHLLTDLIELGLWNDTLKQKLIAHNGSVQNIPEIPDAVKSLYKTVWEISQKTLIDMAADRGAFIDQSQSLNVFINNPNFGKLTSLHFYAWKKGLKTGMYYLRSQAAADAIKFTVDPNVVKQAQMEKQSQKDATNSKPLSASSSSTALDKDKQTDTATAPAAVTSSSKDELEAWRVERQKNEQAMVCSLNNRESCLACSS